jgi:N-acetylmuramoyl-L-alanine amidase
MPRLRDAMIQWGETIEPLQPGEAVACASDRACADNLEDPETTGIPPEVMPEIDIEARAATVTYAHNGKLKRDRYPRVKLKTRRVVIVLHQTGVERSEARCDERAHLVTCHRLIGPTGRRYRVHPLDVRLVAANRLDRAPWHAINIEVAGNFEGEDGSGVWWNPARYGRGRAGVAQIRALREEIVEITREVRQTYAAEVTAIVPHRVSGIDERGRPNRPIDCGSRLWAEGGEWAGAMLGLQIPAVGWKIGGEPVPETWHGPYYDRCKATIP